MAKKILVIDDDPLMVKLYTETFSQEGYQMDHAPDGNTGLVKAKAVKPNLILLDIMMPGSNGLEVLDKLKIDPETKSIPVIILTNHSNEGDEKESLQKGAVKYIPKSKYEPREMVYIVKQII